MQKIFFLIVLSLLLRAEQHYTNALIKEHSPYLQQHAHNPVNWYPWGVEAFEKAKKEHKLIFLSIGYSTCHWCHVMEEESFTDVSVAKLLNDDFISIKVDREQYPQIDKKYQKIYRDVYGKRGGWPLSIFMTADKEVFFMGTYIPKEEGYGSKGLLSLLPSFVVLNADTSVLKQAIEKHKKKHKKHSLQLDRNEKLVSKVVSAIAAQYDSGNGGFATHPKFPEASKIDLLLDIYRLMGNQKAWDMAELTLKKMARSGLYDQVHGGFFRYTIDSEWKIPHFEKMLYTNTELVAVYVKMVEMTGDGLYKKVVEESIKEMEKHYMKEGVYLSASDADSDGEEGGYFIYEYLELKSALKEQGWKAQEIEDVLSYMGIEEDGNIDGEFSQPHITRVNAPMKLEVLKSYMQKVSAKRTFPFVDNKINTAWNAMMIKALFMASKIDEAYLTLAKRRVDALLKLMYPEGVLYHQTLLGKTPTQKALLEDYAFLIDALIAGYERTYDNKYLKLAQSLTIKAIDRFYKEKRWYLSDDGLNSEADFDDRYYTSALSVMLDSLLRMASLTDRLKYNAIVKDTFTNMGGILKINPASASKLVHTFLRREKGNIIIHAKKEKLHIAQAKLDKVQYPFLLSAVEESDEYLACKTTMCFAHDKNITKLIEKINEAVK
ncbi:MAG: thioredoxin domain-containing protein [Epsilonproteobacteria bacterium]|nr:thioredoxin domain-containing protein [Campylobacterota bacterium]